MSSAIHILTEESIYIALVILAVVYGVYCISTYTLLTRTNLTHSLRLFYVFFGSILLVLNTLYFQSLPLMGQTMWLTDRSKDGGPFNYFSAHQTTARYMLLGNAAQNIAFFLADSLLIYRCYIIFGSRIWVIVLPALCNLGTIATSMSTIPIGLQSNADSPLERGMNAASIILTMIVNVMAISMISFKILWVLRKTRKGTSEMMKRMYINVIAILVESAAPGAILGVISTVLLLSGSPFWNFFVIVWSAYMAIFPQLIIYRIAHGIAWDKDDIFPQRNDAVFTSTLESTACLRSRSSYPDAFIELYDLPKSSSQQFQYTASVAKYVLPMIDIYGEESLGIL